MSHILLPIALSEAAAITDALQQARTELDRAASYDLIDYHQDRSDGERATQLGHAAAQLTILGDRLTNSVNEHLTDF